MRYRLDADQVVDYPSGPLSHSFLSWFLYTNMYNLLAMNGFQRALNSVAKL